MQRSVRLDIGVKQEPSILRKHCSPKLAMLLRVLVVDNQLQVNILQLNHVALWIAQKEHIQMRLDWQNA